MSRYFRINSIQVEENFYNFVCDEVLPGTMLDKNNFWKKVEVLLVELNELNKSLLKERVRLQHSLDEWNDKNYSKSFSMDDYKSFLIEIGYLCKEGKDFKISTQNIDPEIGTIAGPQLVVPVTNARYALNAANARWGSLYDAVYGTDIMGDMPSSLIYDPTRGMKVISWVRNFLDTSIPLIDCSWSELSNVFFKDNKLFLMAGKTLICLADRNQFRGISIDRAGIKTVLFKNNGLGIMIVLNSDDKIGGIDNIGISDILLESSISVIMDFEDSVAAVDPNDKIIAYRNWLGLMKGELQQSFQKSGAQIKRKLEKDRIFYDESGKRFIVKGRALMLVRNVGHLMTTGLILNESGEEVGEGLIDCIITAASGLHDLLKSEGSRNSVNGSIYIVKPKMHGPSEVGFTVKLFSAVEKLLSLPKDTLKLGIMDEERRTSLNLKECIRQAKSRVAFINTGFLDRTGDEIHSSQRLGPMVKKSDMKKERWINAYEKNNVQVGLKCGFRGRAQIGKGMWAIPDKMRKMFEEKSIHPRSGGNCAWVPSPTAATIHAMHYHDNNVSEIQAALLNDDMVDYQNDLLAVPVAKEVNWTKYDIEEELFNNVQGILGYVVRWVDQGIGCSKVPDINGIGLMEDRATCRISSQHIANWLYHRIISESDIILAFKRMAPIVDEQNRDDKGYIPMAPSFDGFAYMASLDLVLKGLIQPSGYTEPLLHLYREKKKRATRVF